MEKLSGKVKAGSGKFFHGDLLLAPLFLSPLVEKKPTVVQDERREGRYREEKDDIGKTNSARHDPKVSKRAAAGA